MTSTLDDLRVDTPGRLRRRRIGYGAATAMLTAVMALGVVDAVGWLDVYGVDTARVRASGGGYELEVQYGTVSRPALATPFEIVVTRAGGFAGPVTVAVDERYLELWDANAIVPAPSGEISADDWVRWEFDPPAGDVLRIFYDGRIEPAAQSGRSGRVAVLDDGTPVVEVDFHTRVLP